MNAARFIARELLRGIGTALALAAFLGAAVTFRAMVP